jgi:hypothetical protein
MVAIKGLASAVRASPAGGRNKELVLQCVETSAAIADFTLDVAVRHTPADAHDHERAPFAMNFNFNVSDTAALQISVWAAV